MGLKTLDKSDGSPWDEPMQNAVLFYLLFLIFILHIRYLCMYISIFILIIIVIIISLVQVDLFRKTGMRFRGKNYNKQVTPF